MPLNIEDIPEGWHGFLLETVMLYLWPSLAEGKRPKDDPKFEGVLKILRVMKTERQKLKLL